MGSFIIGLITVTLILVSIFMVLVILMQRPSANAGMGASLGGGFSESTFGAESGNVLTRWTIYAAVAFFVLSFGLGLFHMSKPTLLKATSNGGLPQIVLPVEDGKASAEIAPGSLTDLPKEK